MRSVRYGSISDLRVVDCSYRRVMEVIPWFLPMHCTQGDVLVTRDAFGATDDEYSVAMELTRLANDAWLVQVKLGMTQVELEVLRGVSDDIIVTGRLAACRLKCFRNAAAYRRRSSRPKVR